MADITIDQVREKYPQYKDMSDQQLAEGLHKKFYSDMPVDDFNKKIGYSEKPVAAPKEESFTDRVGRKFNETTDYLGKEITQPFRHVPELKKTISEIPETFKNSLGTADQWKNSSPALMYRSEFGNDAESAEARKKMIDKASGVWDSAKNIGSQVLHHPIDSASAVGQGIGSAASELYHKPEVAIPRAIGSTIGSTLREPETLAVPQMASMAGSALKPVAGLAKNILPEIKPEVLELARKAQANGIPLRPDMLYDNRLMRMVGDTLEQVPLTGQKLAQRQTAFNQAVIEKIGGDVTKEKITPDVFRKAIETSGKKIGELSEKYPIKADATFSDSLKSLRDDLSFETSDTEKIGRKYLDEIAKHTREGAIDGTEFRKIRTKLTAQMRRASDGDVRASLNKIDDFMLDKIQSHLSAEELPIFNDARYKYANAKTIEPIIAKGNGDIPASQLMQRLTATSSGKSAMAKGKAGDLGDLARIGQRFLNDPLPPRINAGVQLGELGAGIVAPGATAGVIGAGNAYNRLAPYFANKLIRPPE